MYLEGAHDMESDRWNLPSNIDRVMYAGHENTARGADDTINTSPKKSHAELFVSEKKFRQRLDKEYLQKVKPIRNTKPSRLSPLKSAAKTANVSPQTTSRIGLPNRKMPKIPPSPCPPLDFSFLHNSNYESDGIDEEPESGIIPYEEDPFNKLIDNNSYSNSDDVVIANETSQMPSPPVEENWKPIPKQGSFEAEDELINRICVSPPKALLNIKPVLKRVAPAKRGQTSLKVKKSCCVSQANSRKASPKRRP